MKAKIIQRIFHTMEEQTRDRLLQYLDSPLHTPHRRLVDLVRFLFPYCETSSPQVWDEQALYQILYPGSDGSQFQKQRIYDHLSFLRRALADFLAWEQFQQDPFQKRLNYLEQLLQYKEFHALNLSLNRWRRQAYKVVPADPQYYLEEYQLSQVGDQSFSLQLERRFDSHLNEQDQHLDHFYIAAKLQQACEMRNRQNVIQGQYHSAHLPEILRWVAESPTLLAVPAIAVYYHLYRCLTETEVALPFAAFRSLLKQTETPFRKKELATLYNYAQNICTKQINRGNPSYLQAYFELDQEMLAKDLLVEAGMLDHRKYKNVVTVGLRLGEFDWVEGFLERYKNMVGTAFQVPAYHYNRAALHFARKEYPLAQRHLWKVELDDVYYQLGKRALLLKIYFEIEDYEGLEDQVRAFRAYLRRNRKVSTYQYKAHASLIRFTQRLGQLATKRYRLTEKSYQEALLQIETGLKETQPISNQGWLQQQIERYL